MKKYMCCLVVLVLFFQCKSGPAFKATDANNGSSFDINKGEIFTVSLKAQLSTGFSWSAQLSNESIIVQKGKPKVISIENKKEIKTGGIELQQFTFEGIQRGSTELILKYSQPWTKKDPVEVYKIIINVN